VENLRSEDKDTITRENVLGALQKLSLRYLRDDGRGESRKLGMTAETRVGS